MNEEKNKKTLSMLILAGGQSLRMGSDKADLTYEGETFLECQIKKGRQLGIEEILVSGYRGTSCSLPVIPDRYGQRGPLGGLEAGLRRAGNRYCLVLGVDWPRLPAAVLNRLIEALENSAGEPKAILLKHGAREEPLIGIFDCSLADLMEEELLQGKGSVFRVLNHCGYEVLRLSETEFPEELFCNVNWPEDYERMKGKSFGANEN